MQDTGKEFYDIKRKNATLTNKPMHGQNHKLLQEEHMDQKTSLTWMKDSRLKGHTEAMGRTYIRQLKM